ncbi:MAG: hypothetical protein HZB67_03135 [Candidatus Aenigmarchaeota archaeon]|nr:hypothetical protein [Candidatus Aenigmarchaeota archaeon]
MALVAQSALAARIINSAKLNGVSNVTVTPSATVLTYVNVTTTGSGSAARWRCTNITVQGQTPILNNHPDHDGAGNYVELLNITAPAAPGTYAVSFIAYDNDLCTGSPSNTVNLVEGITVQNIVPEFTYVSALLGLALVAGMFVVMRKK